MKKSYLILAAAAIFAACSSDDGLTEQQAPQAAANDGAIVFDAYAPRTTRAGYAGSINNTGTLQTAKFGVFGYYTNGNDYDPQSIPNFMYNQMVEHTGSWTYAPVKYWPNEYGSSAISDDEDKLTFFAYAPYVEVVPSTGKLTDASEGKDKWGITGMSRNSVSGDPLIKYIASFDEAKSVDLLWGVYDEAAPNTWATNVGTRDFTSKVGFPWIDIEHPASITTSQAVKFTFKHALAQLNVQIDHDADIDAHDDAETGIADATKVYVRSITFTGMATKGSLNLNNTEANKALWLDYNGTADLESGESVTIYDGRKDGKEGALGAIASNEKLLGLNSTIISNDGNTTVGVTKDLKNAFTGSAATTPIYIIPTGEAVNVEIVYDIETADSKLSTYLSDGKTTGSRIENRISKKILFSGESKFENGKSYVIKLHLGMNSVKFDADVTEWASPAVEDNPWLPSNTPMYAANHTYDITVAADAASIPAFTIFGLTPGSAMTATPDGTTVTAAPTISPSSVGTDGKVEVAAATIAVQNTTVSNKVTAAALTITEGSTITETKIRLIQQPKAFKIGTLTINSGYTFDITADAASGTVTDANWADANVTIKKKANGVGTEWVTLTNGTDFTYAGGSGKGTVTLTSPCVEDDKFIVTVQVGDAPADTSTETTVAP